MNMKIMIIGSMKFAKDMVQLKNDLEKLGHIAHFPIGTENHLTDSTFVDRLEDNLQWVIKEDIMRRNFQQVADADAVLVVNKRRNDIEGYIGISALMEMGLAHYLDKKIFLLNPYPSFEEHRWAQEVAIMQPTIINNKLEEIK